MKSVVLGVLLCVLNSRIIIFSHPKDHVEVLFKWKRVVYENLPHPENSNVGIYPYYVPENVDITTAGGYHHASGLFIVLMARFRPGIPTSLGAFCVDDYKYLGSSPKIWGFPNYEVNELHAADFEGGSIEENQGRKIGAKESRYESAHIEVDESRKGHIKPNKDQSYHGEHHHTLVEIPVYTKPTQYIQTQDIRIISIFYTTIDDRCNRAFFMDNGQLVYYRNTTYRIQKPALIVVDLPTNGCKTRNFPIIRRTEVPNKIATRGPDGYMAAALDYQSENSCDDLFLYIPNGFYYFLIVYDYKKDNFWAFEHETFLPIQVESNFVFKKTFEYTLPIGAFAITLGYPDKNGDRIAYYTQMSGTGQYAVSTKVLKNRRKSPENYRPDDFRIMGYLGSGNQPMRTTIDYTNGVMFYPGVQDNQICCWNINKPLNTDNIDVVYESDIVQMGLYTAIDPLGYLWFHSSHIPIDYTTAIPLNLEEVNSRTFRVKVEDAIKGTICEN